MGFTAMGIATILFLVPILLAALFLRWQGSFASRVAGAALMMAGVFLGASPAWIHNYFIARDPVFLSAHSGVNFWIGNNPVATGYPKFPPGLHAGQEAMLKDSITSAEKASGRALKRSEVSAYWSEKASAWIRAHPWDFLRLLGTKIRNFWSAFSYDDISVITALRDQSVILPGLGFGLVAALGLPGLLIAWRKIPGSRWLGAAVFLHMASLLTVFVTERYRLAAVPGLLLFAAFGLCELWRDLAQRALSIGRVFLSPAFLQHCICFHSTKRSNALGPGHLQLRAAGARSQEFFTRPAQARSRLCLLAGECRNQLCRRKSASGNWRRSDREAILFSKRSASIRLMPGPITTVVSLLSKRSAGSWPAIFSGMRLSTRLTTPRSIILFARAELKSGEVAYARREIARAIQLDGRHPEFFALQKEIEAAQP